jgi:hypothetical protein
MKKLILLFVILITTSFAASAQFFQWTKKQDKAYINNQPQAPFQIYPEGGNFLATGTHVVAQTGLFNSSISFANQTFTSTDSSDAFLAVHDLTGNLLWAKQLMGTTYEQPSVSVDQNDNIIVTGAFYDSLQIGSLLLKSNTGSKQGVYTVKFSAAGNLLWARSSDLSNNTLHGAVTETAISTDLAGNVYIAGIFWGSLTFNSMNLVAVNPNNIYVVKYSPNGVLLWAKAPPISGMGLNISVSPAGKVAIATSSPIQANMTHQVTKLDQNGTVAWTKVIATNWSYGLNLTSDNAENTYLTGYLPVTGTFGNTTLTFTNAG